MFLIMALQTGKRPDFSQTVKRRFCNNNTARFTALAMATLSTFSALAQTEVKLAAENLSWLTEKGQPIIECAFDQMNIPVKIEQVPWKRAQSETQTGKYDGFFMASENDERNAFASFSESFMSVEWVYVVRKSSHITPQDLDFHNKIFAANVGSSRFNWLNEKQKKNEIFYKIFSADTSKQLLNMLLLKRMDVVLENRANIEKISAEGQIDLANFDIHTALIRPLAVYFGHDFLHRNPDFLEMYNRSIHSCISKNGRP